MPSGGSNGGGRSNRSTVDPLSRPQRLLAGILVLLLVDVIWVASSEFTKYIFTDLDFDKPFFTTYFKTSLFMSYLGGFLIYKPWRDQCGRDAVRLRDAVRRQQGRYRRILQHDSSEYDGDESERDTLSSSGEGDDDEEPIVSLTAKYYMWKLIKSKISKLWGLIFFPRGRTLVPTIWRIFINN